MMRFLAILLLAAAPPARAPGVREMISAARRAMDGGEYARAAELYGQLAEVLPQEAAVPYNRGVAHYLGGRMAEAAEQFARAADLAGESGLRSRSLFNLGNAAYAQSLQALQGQGDSQQAAGQLKDATARLEEALRHYKDAIGADPADEDARANAELTHRMLEKLRELQQQQQSQQQNQDQQNQDQQDQQEQGQQQEESQEQQQQEQQQQEQQSQEEQQAQQQQARQQQQQDQQDQPQEAQAQEQQEQEQTKGQAPEEREHLSKEEAERLLQLVRDKERRRREELARREAQKHPPVDKDW